MAEAMLIANLCIFIFIVIPVEFFRGTYTYDMPIGEKLQEGYIPYIWLFCLINLVTFFYIGVVKDYFFSRDAQVGVIMLTLFLFPIVVTCLGVSVGDNKWRNLGLSHYKTRPN